MRAEWDVACSFCVTGAALIASASSGKLAHGAGACMGLRMRIYEREPIAAALRRFRKLLERSGQMKELRKRQHYEKPCDVRRRAEQRKQNSIRKAKLTTSAQ
jgi:small subunit ribosomal protein S21